MQRIQCKKKKTWLNVALQMFSKLSKPSTNRCLESHHSRFCVAGKLWYLSFGDERLCTWDLLFLPSSCQLFFSYRRNGRMGNVTVLECSSSHVLRCGGNFQFSFIFPVLIFCMCDSVLSDAKDWCVTRIYKWSERLKNKLLGKET